MPQIIDEDEHNQIAAGAVDQIARATNRANLIAILPELAVEAAAALSAAGLHIPIFFSIPNSGHAIITFATPIDPTDAEWHHACRIACAILEAKTGKQNLTARELFCCSGGMPAIGVAELHPTVGSLGSNS
jgi:hypothetical protein